MDKIQDALNQAYVGEAKAALRLKVYAKRRKMKAINKWRSFSASLLFRKKFTAREL